MFVCFSSVSRWQGLRKFFEGISQQLVSRSWPAPPLCGLNSSFSFSSSSSYSSSTPLPRTPPASTNQQLSPPLAALLWIRQPNLCQPLSFDSCPPSFPIAIWWSSDGGWGWSLFSPLPRLRWSLSRSEAAVGILRSSRPTSLNVPTLHSARPWQLRPPDPLKTTVSFSVRTATSALRTQTTRWKVTAWCARANFDLENSVFPRLFFFYVLGLIFLSKIVISTECWPAYLFAIAGLGWSHLGRFLEVAPLQFLCCILFHITSHVISFFKVSSTNPHNFTFVTRAIWDDCGNFRVLFTAE